MKSNNPFTRHGIEHLSPSKINLWVTDPALFIGTYLCGMKGSYGVGAFRGTAVEFALNKKIVDTDLSKEATNEFLYGSFNEQCIEKGLSTECFNYFGYHISRQEILSPVGRIENKLEESDDEDEELVVASVLNSLKTLPVGDIGLLMKKEEIVTLRHYCEKQIQDG